MSTSRRSIFAIAAGRRAKWVVFLVWLVGMFIAFGANLPGKFTDAEENESTSFLPGDAESTKVLTAAEELQGGELAPAVIVYRREGGLTPADFQKIDADAQRLTEKRFPAVVADGATRRPEAGRAKAGSRAARPAAARAAARPRATCRRVAEDPPHRFRASPTTTRPSSGRSARRTARPRSSRRI